MADGSVKISTELDNSGFESGIKDTRKTFSQMAKETGKSIEQIKDEVKSLAETYQKEGLNIPLSYKKAYAEMGLYAKDAALEAEQSAEKISDAFEDSAENIKKSAQSSANSISDSYSKAADKSVSDFESKLSKLSTVAATGFKAAGAAIGVVAGASTAAVGGLLAIESATEEYRIAQGKLNTAFQAAGYSIETAQEAYRGLYQIIGETDTTAEAAQQLSALARSQEDLIYWQRIGAGVAGEFGDALPLENLYEASNETSRTGVLTGQLVDAIIRAGISEDDFNAALAAAGDEASRNQLIMETLGAAYNETADIFYENNAALIQARDNQILLDNALANLGNTISSVKNQVAAEFTPEISELINAFVGVLTGVEGADQAFTDALSQIVSTAASKIPDFMDLGLQILQSLASAMISSAPVLAAAFPEILVQIGTALGGAASTFGSAAISLLQSLADGMRANIGTLLPAGMEMLVQFSENLRTNAGLFVDAALSLIKSLAEGLINGIPTFIQTVPQIITNLANIINDNAPKLIATGLELIAKLALGLIQAIPTLIANIPQIIQAIVAVFMAYNWIQLGISLITWLKDGLLSMVGALQGAAANLLNAIGNGLKSLPGMLLNLGKQGITFLINGIKSVASGVLGAIQTIGTTILNGIKAIPGQIYTIGSQIVQGLINGIKGSAAKVGSAISGLASNAINSAKKTLGIASPSKVFKQIGRFVTEGLAIGIEELADKVYDAVIDLTDSMKDAVNEGSPEYKKALSNMLKSALRDAENEFSSYEEIGDSLSSKIVDGFKARQEQSTSEIEDSINQIIEEIEDEETKTAAENAGEIVMEAYNDAMEQGLQQAQELVDTRITALTDDFQRQYDDIISAQESLASKLSEGDLFTFDKDQLVVEDLDKTIETLEAYGAAVEQLKTYNVSDAILGEIAKLDAEEGLQAVNYLLDLAQQSEDAFQLLSEKWDQKQVLSVQIAQEFYKDQLDTLEESFHEKLLENLEVFPDELEDIGKYTIEGFMQGVNEKIPAAEALVQKFAEQMVATIQATMGIASPSKKTMWMGKILDEGLANGVTQNEGIVKSAINRMSVLDAFAAKIPSMQAAMTGFVSGMAPAYAGMSTTQTINRNTTQTVRIVADQQGIFDLVEAESKRRGKSLVSGKGIL